MILYSNKWCPYSKRAILSLDFAGIDYQLIEIDLKNKPQWFIDLTERGTVPVLQTTESVIKQSIDIVKLAFLSIGDEISDDEITSVARVDSLFKYSFQKIKSGESTVVGGASKIIKYVRTKFTTMLFSYSDRRWFDGTVYHSLGMTLVRETTPGYLYSVGDKRLDRRNFTKAKLVEAGYDSSKTEKTIMEELGFDRIWDCGHWYFEMTWDE